MTAKIVKYTTEKEKKKEYIAYHIECKLRDLNWSVKKRYSECHAFHTRLSSTLVTKDHRIEFPPKLFGKSRNFSAASVEKRLAGLQTWFDKITTADSVWFSNYEALIHDFLATNENLAMIVANRCKVEVDIARHKLSQFDSFLCGLPDWNQAIESIMNDKTHLIMQQTGEDYQKSRKALCENQNTVELAAKYLGDIQLIMKEKGLTERSVAVNLYYKYGSDVNACLASSSVPSTPTEAAPAATTGEVSVGGGDESIDEVPATQETEPLPQPSENTVSESVVETSTVVDNSKEELPEEAPSTTVIPVEPSEPNLDAGVPEEEHLHQEKDADIKQPVVEGTEEQPVVEAIIDTSPTTQTTIVDENAH